MTSSRRLKDTVTVAVTMMVALVALRQSARHPGEVSTLDRGILAIISPVQGALSSLTRGVVDAASRYVDLLHVRAENDELRRQNDRLRGQLLEAKRLAAESARYQELLGLKNAAEADTLSARVIALDASPYFRVARVVLDRGQGEVRRGMPVITPDGIVGRISRVSGPTSDILLAVDPRSAIDVIVPRTGGRGILRGKAGENGYRCAIEYLTRGEPVKDGDAVVTSGLGGGFPRDLPVGKITRVMPSNSSLHQDVEVTPDVNFARLAEVLVVVTPPPAPDPDNGGSKRPMPTGGVMMVK